MGLVQFSSQSGDAFHWHLSVPLRVSGPQTKTDFWLPALVTSLHPSLMDMMILSVLPIPKIACLSRAYFRGLSLLFVCPWTWCGSIWPRSCNSPRLKPLSGVLPLRLTERRSFTTASSVKYQGFGIPGFLPMLQERSENSNSVNRIVSLHWVHPRPLLNYHLALRETPLFLGENSPLYRHWHIWLHLASFRLPTHGNSACWIVLVPWVSR